VALFFIVWLQPLLASIWIPKNKIVQFFWDIITVSFAAQIGTFPMSIYYFHQFPGLFFITNLVILPGMSLILGLGVIVLFLAAFDIIWMQLLKVLEWFIWILNKVIAWVASFEGFVFKDLPLSLVTMWAMYLLIFSLIIWIKKPSFKKLVVVLLALISLQITALTLKYFCQSNQELIVFNCKKATLITERFGDQVTVFSSIDLNKNKSFILTLNSYLVGNSCQLKNLKVLPNVLYFKNKKILIINKDGNYFLVESPDAILLVNNPKINLDRVIQDCNPKLIIADGSSSKFNCKLWKATCEKEKIPFHNTFEKGFYKL
jgi:competence protein ComEC